jgi:hypothetical protein
MAHRILTDLSPQAIFKKNASREMENQASGL